MSAPIREGGNRLPTRASDTPEQAASRRTEALLQREQYGESASRAAEGLPEVVTS